MANKLVSSAALALEGLLFDGMTIMSGGFGLCGIPENLIAAIAEAGPKDLTVVSNNCGIDDFGLGILLAGGQIRKMISSYVGENKLFEKMYLAGKLELEFNRTGVGTLVAEGKEVRVFDGEAFVMERGLTADLAIVKAWKGDGAGNLVFRKTARNFNPMMATAGKVTVAEVETLVAVGDLDPDSIHTPGIFVDRIFQGAVYERRIERVTTRARADGAAA
jgi:3-oxoacid CoA-transferase subunit A